MQKRTTKHFEDTKSILCDTMMESMCPNPQNVQQQVWPALKLWQLAGKAFSTESSVETEGRWDTLVSPTLL